MAVLERPFCGWGDLLCRPVFELLPHLRPWLSLDSELARYFRDPRVRLAFSFQSKYLGMSPFKCPSLFSILSFIEHENGVHHPIGGCASVTRAMARLVEEFGGDIRLDEPVEEILFDRKRAVGVRTQRRELQSRRRDRQRRLRARHLAADAGPPSPPLDGPEDRPKAPFMFDVHDVSRDRGVLRSS